MFDAAPLERAYPPAPVNSIASRLDHLLNTPVTAHRAGSEIYAEGDRSGVLYQIAYGVVRIYRLLADGRRQICAFHMPGEVFGFDAGAERHFFADAVNPVGLRILRPGNDALLTQELLKLALRSLSRAHDHVLTMGRNDASGRVAEFLLELADRQDSRHLNFIDLPMSRADIADYLGLTIETVSRVLTRFKESHILRLNSTRHLDIVRWDALEDLTA